MLSGEEAVNAIACRLEEPHVTDPWMRAYSKIEREEGMYRQAALAVVSSEDLPDFDEALKDILDTDELWVMKRRAMGESREGCLARQPETDRLRFQAAWRRLSRKMDRVKAALREKAGMKSA
jgi:hypothetical protein